MEKVGIITASDFTDLDGYACAIAYNELLKLEGKDSEIIIPGKINASVTDEIRSWKVDFLKKPSPETKTFISVDNSYIKIIPDYAIDNLIEIYDHREWDKEFWQQRIGDGAHIETLGAAATQIWEEFIKRGKEKEISQISARLLYTAIICNTLNFTAKNTKKRDIKAAKQLLKISDLPKDWVEKYFADWEKEILKDPYQAIINDTKEHHFYEGIGKRVTMGQLELWDSEKFVLENEETIKKAVANFGSEFWFFNAPSISKGTSFIVTDNDYIKDLLSKEFGVKFEKDIGKTDRVIERKEYMDRFLKL
ncbi:hypothetical protein ACFLZ4_01140 [Patescibacteria group bacterium]